MRFAKLSFLIVGISLALALLAACSGGDDSGEAASAASDAAESAQPPQPAAAEEPARDGEAITETAQLASTSDLTISGPRIIRTADIAISVDPGQFDRTIDRVRVIADGAVGFFTNSSREVYDEETKLISGSATLRVPNQRYAGVMEQLTSLGTVEQRTERGEDVSRDFVDLEARGRHLEAVEIQLLGFLEDTGTIKEALAVQGRLNDVQLQLEQIKGQLRFLEDQTSLATITMSVSEIDADALPIEAVATSDDGWGVVDAWRVAANGFLAVIGGTFVVLATAGPILLVIGIAYLGWRVVRRRRLDGATTASSGAA
jgi:hypothetical protein